MDDRIVETLCNYLDLEKEYVFRSFSPLDLSFVFQIQDALRKVPELFFEKRTPQKSPQFKSGESILAQIKEHDKLLSYPYESIKPFLKMLHEAANDENVVSIKMTLYRLARQSKVIEALVEAGCRVIYGLDGYKVHSKLCLITRRTEKGVEYYTQVGTGNYNEKTSKLYTDLSFMTANVELGIEAANVFQALDKGETVKETRQFLVAPNCLQNKVIEMIEDEIRHAKAGEESYIGLKMNSLTDKKIIDKLVEASCAGVKIDMIIRGICCLIPGVKDKTENITVRSIVGRFLEHSRIYIFGTGERTKIYIASADFMTRNTVRRVEVAAPIHDPELKLMLSEMFISMLSDNQKARQEDNKGNYYLPVQAEVPFDSQEFFYEEAYKNAGAE